MNTTNTTKVTGADILRMCPGLKQAMDNVLDACRESHTKNVSEDTPVNMSSYKDSIQNAETSEGTQKEKSK